MNFEINETDKENFYKANVILSFIFIIINIFIMTISKIKDSTQNNSIKNLKTKLYEFISIDSIVLIIKIVLKNYGYSLIYELLFSSLISLEFLAFISFIYQIFNMTELSTLSNDLQLINPIHLAILSFLILFSYHKFLYAYTQLISFIEYIILLCCLVLFYKYLERIIITITRNLLSDYMQVIQIYYYLKMLNLICLILLLSFNILKILLKISLLFIPNTIFQIYIEVLLNIINQALIYSIIILFGVIIYALNKSSNDDNNNNNTEETVEIIQKKN